MVVVVVVLKDELMPFLVSREEEMQIRGSEGGSTVGWMVMEMVVVVVVVVRWLW